MSIPDLLMVFMWFLAGCWWQTMSATIAMKAISNTFWMMLLLVGLAVVIGINVLPLGAAFGSLIFSWIVQKKMPMPEPKRG